MLQLRDHVEHIKEEIANLERSLKAFEDGTMRLFQGPSGPLLTDITDEHTEHLRKTKETYERILASLPQI